jgi:hypothetical protein
MSNIQKLGEFKTVNNEDIDNNLQSKTLTIGYVELDGKTVALAFTGKELNRPQKRAKDNREDIPTLARKQPTHEDLKSSEDKLTKSVERNANTQKELDFLKSRGFFGRLFNIQPCKDDQCPICPENKKESK